MEALLTHGEGLLVPERMIIAPSVGVFRALDDLDEGDIVGVGQTVGVLDGPGTSTPVCSPFRGRLVGMLVHPGERLREGQPVAWLRVA
jgi:biotin carboxyl carrier protein